MKLKVLLVCLFAAGLGASYALADNGPGKGDKGDNGKAAKCKTVHVQGTVAAQTLTVTLDKGAKHLSLAAGSQVVLQLGGTGQTVRVKAEACSTTTGTTTTFLVKSAELDARNQHPAPTTTAATTTAATTTSH
jgi:hypothetical protein